jgi:hypothetical protein
MSFNNVLDLWIFIKFRMSQLDIYGLRKSVVSKATNQGIISREHFWQPFKDKT